MLDVDLPLQSRPLMQPEVWFSLACCSLALAATVAGIVRAWSSTLVAPLAWAVIALATIAGDVLAKLFVPWDYFSPLRYCAAAVVFCPLMALLGAKRPQSWAWQWVVVCLLVTLWLPAATSMAVHPGEPFVLPDLWRLMLAALLVMHVLNYLFTRHYFAMGCVVFGQFALLQEFLFPAFDPASAPTFHPIAAGCFALAGSIVWLQIRARRTQLAPDDPFADVNRRWWRFRDAYGGFWAIRVLQRINQTAEAANWPHRLSWQGWHVVARDKETDPDGNATMAQQATTAMDRVLWRFEKGTPKTMNSR